MRSMDEFRHQAAAYFDSLTPEDPAYWATEIFDLHDSNGEKLISKRGIEETKRLESMEWNEVLIEFVRWWIKGMSMTHVIDTYFNTGNSSPYQYGWYPHGFSEIAAKKIIDKYRDRITLDDPKDKLKISRWFITVERNLGYGQSVTRSIRFNLDFSLSSSRGKVFPKFKAKVKCTGTAGFYDYFSGLAKEIQSELDTLSKDPIFKTDVSVFESYPDISQYKDKHDQLGIIKAYARWDTVGRGSNIKFNKNYIAAYKDAAEYCPGVPRVEYSDDLKTCVYNGQTYTAEELDRCCSDRVPDSLQYITQGVLEVLIHKYGLLETSIEDDFTPAHEIRSHVHWIHNRYKMPIDEHLQSLVDKYKVELWKD